MRYGRLRHALNYNRKKNRFPVARVQRPRNKNGYDHDDFHINLVINDYGKSDISPETFSWSIMLLYFYIDSRCGTYCWDARACLLVGRASVQTYAGKINIQTQYGSARARTHAIPPACTHTHQHAPTPTRPHTYAQPPTRPHTCISSLFRSVTASARW